MIPNLIAFYGADHKVGTTMVSLSVSKLLAAYHPEMKILYLSMDGRSGDDYLERRPQKIDSLRMQIEHRMVQEQEWQKFCHYDGNLFMLSGPEDELDIRYYFPEQVRYLLEQISPSFDFIIADCGSDIDSGLAVGTLQTAAHPVLVMTQHEICVRRLEKRKRIYEALGIALNPILVNQYDETHTYERRYLANRMEVSDDRLWKLAFSANGRKAEMDQRTIFGYKNDPCMEDFFTLANHLLSMVGLPQMNTQRKKKWISFI